MKINLGRGVAVTAALMAAWASPGRAAENEGWRVELVPYVWVAGIDADVEVGGRSGEVDASFSDLVDYLDMAAAILANARYDSWVLRAQVDYLDLSSDLRRANGSLESETTMASLAFGYQFRFGGGHTLDLLAGARNLAMDNKLKLDAFGNSDSDKDYTDPIIMLEPSFRLSKRWRFNALASYGEGGDSEYTYELQPQFIYQGWKHVELRLGYRQLHYKIESGGRRDASFDGDFKGPFIGIGATFGSAPAPAPAPVVAAAAPEPAPAPPPTDSDGDGVPDDRDRCPGTPRGQRVDAIGCGYDIHVEALFDSDSATIRPESREALERAADLLRRVPTLRGVVEGHTDSTGSAAHNQRLSERRAAAVSEYLVGRGIDPSRVPARGLGESDPIADNHTAEGRALNRRVVLRRTDGGG